MRAFIGLGSNIGDREGYLRAALAELGGLGVVRRTSSFYGTEPVGAVEQGWFVNAVAELETKLAPRELLAGMRKIEDRAGRQRTVPQGPRTLDLDLLLYENEVIVSKDLTVPHPEMAARRFVLEPLAEIAPDARDPRSGRTALELLAGLADPHRVRKLP